MEQNNGDDFTQIDVNKLYKEQELGDELFTNGGGGGCGDGNGNKTRTRTRTRRPPTQVDYKNSLPSRQMESLTAICDTLLPSIHLFPSNTSKFSNQQSDDLHNFFKTSASMAGTPDRIGGFWSSGRFQHPALGLVKMALWMLSTWFGTFILCGWASLSTEFPYFQRFSQLPLNKREKILTDWSLSYFHKLRMLFNSMKVLTMLLYFTQVDEKNENPSWKALNYCGPDPEFAAQIGNSQTKISSHETEKKSSNEEEELMFGPLQRGIVYPRIANPSFAATLHKSGFPVLMHDQNQSQGRTKSRSSPSLTIECDVVVVGSGSGGGVVAGILAKAGYKVIVLEKGDYYARSNLSLLEGPTLDHMYQGSGMVSTTDLSVLVLAGATVGGGSTINWSASITTPQHVRREWCDHCGIELFGSKLYNEALDAVCGRMGVQPCVHEEGLNNALLRKGCRELCYPLNNIPRNSSSDHDCGWCCFGCKDGRKKGTSETWLVDMVDSGNGLILPGCEAMKVIKERKKGRTRDTATGVAFRFNNSQGKEIYQVKSKVTVVAGGALCTPVLLRSSGLKNPNIGKHLHLHPVVMAWGHFGEEKQNSYEGGIMTAMSTVVGDFEDSGYGAVIQTPSLHPGIFSALTPWVSGVDIKERMIKFPRTAHIFALARDVGSGKVNSLTSLEYKIDKRDEEKLQRGLEKVLRILVAAGADEIGTQHCEGKSLKVKEVSWNKLEQFVKEESAKGVRELVRPVCSAHQMGSCRMGTEAKGSVVDQRGETWEVERLFLADSSVFPTALGVNPMVTVQAIAYCTAQSILKALGRMKGKHEQS